MRAGESSTTIKKMQYFLDKLDKHVLNRKILGGVKVKHVVAAFMAYKALQGMGNIENAQTAGDVFAGGVKAIAAMGTGFGMIGERHFDGKPADSERTELNRKEDLRWKKRLKIKLKDNQNIWWQAFLRMSMREKRRLQKVYYIVQGS